MDERTRRIGRNEALFRQINEQVEGLNRSLAELTDETFHIVCECGDLKCQERMVVPLTRYEEVRGDSALFLVLPGHEIPSTETVIETSRRYNIVRKDPGAAQQIASLTDPRD
jgi:hypothetical protein